MATVASRAERFSGFSDEAIQFFLELQAEQNRTWFKAHQDDFLRLCRRPLELFVGELQERLVEVYPGMAEVEPHYFRIQRDTRFAKDKAPYKTNVAGDLPIRPRREGEDQHTTPGLYLSFGLDGEYVAIGAWHMAPEVLAHYRSLLDDRRRGPEIVGIVRRLQADGWQLEAMEKLKRVPPPYPHDHLCAELLKHKGLALSMQPEEGVSATPASDSARSTASCTIDELPSILHLVTVGLWVLYIVGRLTGVLDPSLIKLAVFWVLAILSLIVVRAVARSLARRLHLAATAAQSALCGRESTRNVPGALRADLAETPVRGIRVALALGL